MLNIDASLLLFKPLENALRTLSPSPSCTDFKPSTSLNFTFQVEGKSRWNDWNIVAYINSTQKSVERICVRTFRYHCIPKNHDCQSVKACIVIQMDRNISC